jgi:hypothetical protein
LLSLTMAIGVRRPVRRIGCVSAMASAAFSSPRSRPILEAFAGTSMREVGERSS